MNKVVPLFLVLGLILIGCSGRINSDSKENYQKSIISMTKRMSQDERSSFMDDIALLNRKYGGFNSTVDDPDLRFLAHINGKSISDIAKESLEIKRQDKIATIKNDISLSNQNISQLETNIATKLEEIQQLKKSIETAEIQEESRKDGAIKAKEILDKLVISEPKYSRPPEDKERPLWMRNFEKARMDFKIINGTEYLVDIENVTINSGKGKVVIRGGYQCKGPGNQMLGLSWRIQPKGEKTIQCEIDPNVDIDDSGTIEISGGEVLGVGEYNPESESPLDKFGDFMVEGNKARLLKEQAELENMTGLLPHHQASRMQLCNELAEFGESYFLCRP